MRQVGSVDLGEVVNKRLQHSAFAFSLLLQLIQVLSEQTTARVRKAIIQVQCAFR
jgi:hypothetical protein